jgi:hypothetical protein
MLTTCEPEVTIFAPAPGDDYVLKSIAGVDLPAPWAEYEGISARMMSATLTLREDGTGTWRAVTESELNGPTTEWESEVTYSLDGSGIAIDFVCSDLADCIAGPHFLGEVTATGILISTSTVMRAPLVFDAVQ